MSNTQSILSMIIAIRKMKRLNDRLSATEWELANTNLQLAKAKIAYSEFLNERRESRFFDRLYGFIAAEMALLFNRKA